jgi:D-alanine--poly(phosphoribitol) ligase subunit 2
MNENLENKVLQIVSTEISKMNDELEDKIDLINGRDTRLFGGGGALDSLSLVMLIVNIEEAIDTELGVTITIADERAMSRRVSPFASIGLLTEYVVHLIAG